MTRIKIIHTADEQYIIVRSPYHQAYVQRARALGGRWLPADKAWQYDASAEDAVRQALRELAGERLSGAVARLRTLRERLHRAAGIV